MKVQNIGDSSVSFVISAGLLELKAGATCEMSEKEFEILSHSFKLKAVLETKPEEVKEEQKKEEVEEQKQQKKDKQERQK